MASRLRRFYLSYLSKPACERPVYRLVSRLAPKRILEIGLDDTRRAGRLLEAALARHGGGEIFYTGIDLFELRAANPLRLKDAYRRLRPTGVRLRLVPGTPAAALAQVANELRQTDLVLISAAVDDAQLAPAWFFFPRMLHAGSRVLRWLPSGQPGQPVEPTLHEVSPQQIGQWAVRPALRRAA